MTTKESLVAAGLTIVAGVLILASDLFAFPLCFFVDTYTSESVDLISFICLFKRYP